MLGRVDRPLWVLGTPGMVMDVSHASGDVFVHLADALPVPVVWQ